jgi:toxin-antitoxin system PIN domain toxin
MIFPDVNVLLYAYDETSQFYSKASAWLESTLADQQVFFSWHTITAFLRISTSSRIWSSPIDLRDAVSIVTSWLERDNVHLISLEKRNWPLFSAMLLDGQASGNLVMDAHIAAMAKSCGATVASTDRDFTRFPGILLIDPTSNQK